MATVTSTINMFTPMASQVKNVTYGMKSMYSVMNQLQSSINKSIKLEKVLTYVKQKRISDEIKLRKAFEKSTIALDDFTYAASKNIKQDKTVASIKQKVSSQELKISKAIEESTISLENFNSAISLGVNTITNVINSLIGVKAGLVNQKASKAEGAISAKISTSSKKVEVDTNKESKQQAKTKSSPVKSKASGSAKSQITELEITDTITQSTKEQFKFNKSVAEGSFAFSKIKDNIRGMGALLSAQVGAKIPFLMPIKNNLKLLGSGTKKTDLIEDKKSISPNSNYPIVANKNQLPSIYNGGSMAGDILTTGQLQAQKFQLANNKISKNINASFNKENTDYNLDKSNTFEHKKNIKIKKSIPESSEGPSKFSDKLKGALSPEKIISIAKKGMEMSDNLALTHIRLGQINDGKQSTSQLHDKIFASAQRSNGDYGAMTNNVTKLGLMAGNSFKSNDEVIGFNELIQKSFKIGGASSKDQQSGMNTMIDAMAGGSLGGDGFSSIMENAPMIADAISSFTGKSKNELMEMAASGTLTADIIKGAMFSSADNINTKFDNTPKTFSDMMGNLNNSALRALEPVLVMLNQILNSKGFQYFVNIIIGAVANISTVLENVFNLIGTISDFITNNWSLIAPVIWGIILALIVYNSTMGIAWMAAVKDAAIKAAHTIATWASTAATTAMTIAQNGLNAALEMSPLMWIILLIIALVAIVFIAVAAINKFAGTNISATGVIMGAFATVGAFIGNLFMGLLQIVFGFVEYFYNYFTAIANFFANVFNDPIGAVIKLFAGMADNVLGVLEKIASGMDFIFGSKMAATVQGWRTDLKVKAEEAVKKHGNGKYEEKFDKLDINSALSSLGVNLNRFNYSDAYKTGYSAGEKFESKIENFDIKSIFKTSTNSVDEFNKSFDATSLGNDKYIDKVGEVGKINESVNVSSEDLTTMRELAEMKNIQNFVSLTPTVKVQTGDINNGYDVNTIISRITTALENEITSTAEGVYA